MGGEIRAAAGRFFDQLVARAVEFVAPDLAKDHHAVGAVVGVAVLVALLHVGGPDALLEDQLLGSPRFGCGGVLEGDVLRVRELLVVIEVALRAESSDARRMRFHAEAPASDVDVVNAVVADVAAAEVMPPAPDAG